MNLSIIISQMIAKQIEMQILEKQSQLEVEIISQQDRHDTMSCPEPSFSFTLEPVDKEEHKIKLPEQIHIVLAYQTGNQCPKDNKIREYQLKYTETKQINLIRSLQKQGNENSCFTDSFEAKVELNFIRKTYLLLASQLAVLFGVCCVSYFVPNFLEFQIKNWWIGFICLGVLYILAGIILYIDLRKKYFLKFFFLCSFAVDDFVVGVQLQNVLNLAFLFFILNLKFQKITFFTVICSAVIAQKTKTCSCVAIQVFVARQQKSLNCTLFFSYAFSQCASLYIKSTEDSLILIAIGLTLIMVIGIVVFAFFSKDHLNLLIGIIIVFIINFGGFGILCLFEWSAMLNVLYCGIGVALIGIVLLIDTKFIVAGYKNVGISLDDYILGVLILNADLMTIFLWIFRLLKAVTRR